MNGMIAYTNYFPHHRKQCDHFMVIMIFLNLKA